MAVVKDISLSDFAKLFDKDQKFINENLEKLKKAAYEGALQSVKPLAEKSPVDTGAYQSSWKVEKTPDAVYIGNTIEYAFDVEKGTPPGKKVNIEHLIHWAARKLQKPRDSKEVRNFAFAVQKKIYTKGIEPQHILENELDNILKRIKDNFEKKLQKA